MLTSRNGKKDQMDSLNTNYFEDLPDPLGLYLKEHSIQLYGRSHQMVSLRDLVKNTKLYYSVKSEL